VKRGARRELYSDIVVNIEIVVNKVR